MPPANLNFRNPTKSKNIVQESEKDITFLSSLTYEGTIEPNRPPDSLPRKPEQNPESEGTRYEGTGSKKTSNHTEPTASHRRLLVNPSDQRKQSKMSDATEGQDLAPKAPKAPIDEQLTVNNSTSRLKQKQRAKKEAGRESSGRTPEKREQ